MNKVSYLLDLAGSLSHPHGHVVSSVEVFVFDLEPLEILDTAIDSRHRAPLKRVSQRPVISSSHWTTSMTNLHPGSKRISIKENYVSKQLNPGFGKCFEI
ncbi:otoferlin [Culex quinquefasciatus]|uniref:Otoferlin n=1 Tax=Culex quinquefasciatus TaxID=7176 RepID=B0W5U6_CULQU|nr:otoferlin [Culex quinquefasciatus]|eukprot:XP_001844080.1 otoferlin [Culex quinquefasciatus]